VTDWSSATSQWDAGVLGSVWCLSSPFLLKEGCFTYITALVVCFSSSSQNPCEQAMSISTHAGTMAKRN
jgi:hypothetical protein